MAELRAKRSRTDVKPLEVTRTRMRITIDLHACDRFDNASIREKLPTEMQRASIAPTRHVKTYANLQRAVEESLVI